MLKYYVASTLDGFIAHDDGSYHGFVWDDELVADYLAEIRTYTTVLMGRRTYELGLREGKSSPYPFLRQIVFSRTMQESPDREVELVREDAVPYVRPLREKTEGVIWLCGGADLAGALLAGGLIDELVVKLHPVVFGAGIPLFRGVIGPARLHLMRSRTYERSGIIVLHYQLLR